MKKRGFALLLILCMMSGILGCGQKAPLSPVTTNYEDLKDLKSVDIDPDKKLIEEGINHFAFEMYDKLEEGENIIFSPYSLCTALSILNLGATGDAKAELEEMLGIRDLDAWNNEMRAYLEKEGSDDTYVMTANSVWMQKDREWSEEMKHAFIQSAGFYYNSETYEVDFLEKEKVLEGINYWVNENTKGMIPELMKEIPDGVVLALLNAVYFEGKWEVPFLAQDTYEGTFHGTSKDVQTDMMHQYNSEFVYAQRDGIKGIVLPYRDSDIVMKVFLPIDEDMDIEALFGALSKEEKEALIYGLDQGDIQNISYLALPKFAMEQDLEGLNNILQSMGMQTAFESLNEDLYVSQVIHKAKIEVDEDGTKASASTGVLVRETEALIEEPIQFVADRPFLYVLQDTQTGIILFMGRVNNIE